MESEGSPDESREYKGSRQRCLVLTTGPDDIVAHRLTELSRGRAVVKAGKHAWAPKGFSQPDKAKLGETPPFLSVEHREQVSEWWLEVRHPLANTPNWDIVSQAEIGDAEGLLLVEAKAHVGELAGEVRRKPVAAKASANSLANHWRIGECIDTANVGLRNDTGLPFMLSRDICYQMSNRFSWAWKVTALGMPVVLVYLGFLDALEMPLPIPSAKAWDDLVRSHGAPIAPRECLGASLMVNNTPFAVLSTSARVSLVDGTVEVSR